MVTESNLGGKILKKRWFLIGLFIAILSLTGCTSVVPLSEDEENMIAEYMAKGVLDSQEGYTEALFTPTPTPTPTPTSTPEPISTPIPDATLTPTPTNQPSNSGSSSSSNQQANADFEQVMGMTNIKVEYTGYEIVESLSEGSFHLDPPTKGKQLFIVRFDVTNTSKKQIPFRLGDLNISYLLDLNINQKENPLVTLIDNDLRFIDLKIKAGETKETFVFFEIDKKLKVEQANLIISREDKTAIIKLK